MNLYIDLNDKNDVFLIIDISNEHIKVSMKITLEFHH